MVKEREILLKIMTVGDGAAGKTSMLIKYSTGEFPSEYVPTVFDNYALTVNHEGKDVKVGLWDTGGGEDYPRLRPLSYPQTDVFTLLFDVYRPDALESVKDYWIPEIVHHCPDVPIVLVASKIDLRAKYEKCITSKEGERMAKTIGAARYMEISSLEGEGIDELFKELISVALGYNTSYELKKKKKCTIL